MATTSDESGVVTTGQQQKRPFRRVRIESLPATIFEIDEESSSGNVFEDEENVDVEDEPKVFRSVLPFQVAYQFDYV